MAKNYDVGNIEMNIKSSASESTKAFEDVIAKVKEMTDVIEKATSTFSGVSKGASDLSSGSKKASGDIKDLEKNVDDLGKTSDRTGNKLGKALTIGGTVLLGKKMVGMMANGIQETVKMIQNYRMLEISSGDYFDKAISFQDTLNNKLGINYGDSIGVNAYFQTLTKSLGIANDGANMMSETLTKLTYDFASFFGEDFTSMQTKLQSGLVGQTKPLRNLGVDVTEKTIQGYLDSMGIKALVADLNQAEKVMLRYIAIIDQSRMAHGNLANSIEMPSQQIQVLKSQIKELGQWLWAIFMGTIGKILPYINGFVIALKEMAKAIASLFGFKLQDYGTISLSSGITGANAMSGAVNGIGNSADKTAKKLKKMTGLFGWDEIHNVQTPDENVSPSGNVVGGGGGIGGAGIYDDLLGAMGTYDNLMGNVKMKANDIAKDILSWLGWTYDINKLTGEISNLKWGGFKEMATSAKLLVAALGLMVAVKLGKWAISAYTSMKTLNDIVGSSMLGKSFKSLFSLISMGVKDYGFVGGVKAGASAWWSMVSPLAKVAGGFAGIVAGSLLASSGAKDLAREGELTTGSMLKLTGGIGAAAAGGAVIGSVFPVVGTAIGAVAGAAVGAVAAFFSWNKEVTKLNHEAALFDGKGIPIDEYTKSVKGAIEAVTQASSQTVKWLTAHQESAEAISDVKEEIDFLNTKMSSNHYVTTTKDVEQMTKALEQMTSGVATSGEAYVNSMIAITDKLVQEGNLSKETADIVVASAIRKAKAENDFMQSYSISMNDLTSKLSDGSITQEEFNSSVAKLDEEMKKNVPTVKTATDNLKDFVDAIGSKIDLKSYNDIKKAVKDIGTETEKAHDITTESYILGQGLIDENIKFIEKELKAMEDSGQTGSELHTEKLAQLKAEKDAKEANTTSFKTESDTINRVHAESLATMLVQLNNSGTKMTKESQKQSDDMVKILSDMGYQVDFETGIISSIDKSSGNVNNKWGTAGKGWGDIGKRNAITELGGISTWTSNNPASLAINSLTDGAWGSAQTLASNISSLYPKVKVGTESDGKKLTFGGMVGGLFKNMFSISAFANGGFPDGENGLFYANSSEMVGKLTNGKTAVANNDQIVQGIQRGVEVGVARAMSEINFGGDTIVNMDSKTIAKHTKKRSLDLEFTRG